MLSKLKTLFNNQEPIYSHLKKLALFQVEPTSTSQYAIELYFLENY